MRYQKSDRHFRGSDEEEERQAEHSEVINTIVVTDLSVTRNIGPRWSVSLGIPHLQAERSMPIRDSSGETIDRTVLRSSGFGDLVMGGRRFMLDPRTHLKTNWRLGVGLKLPTGEYDAVDERRRLTGGEYVTTVETVDQSIQPGDGGVGVVVDAGWFLRFAKNRCAAYASGTYLFNPESTNGTPSFRGRPSESILSVADQYLARAGVTAALTEDSAWAISGGLGGRIEGIPAHDVFGASYGFRRPGYSVAIEPTLSFTQGPNTFSLAFPVAVYRNRVRSVPDIADGRHGDAAFADWLLLVGYTRRFGHPSAEGCEKPPREATDGTPDAAAD